MARPASPPRPCRDRTVSKPPLPGRACTDKVDRRTRALRAWENAMVFLGIDVSKGRLDCAVLATEGGRSPGRRSFRNDVEGAERAATWTAQVSGAAAADTHVILEATAAYHEPVARGARDEGVHRQSGAGAQLRQGHWRPRQDRPDRRATPRPLRPAGAPEGLVSPGQGLARSARPHRAPG